MRIYKAEAFILTLVTAAFSIGLTIAGAQAATVYSQDFESGVLGAEWSGAGTIQTTGGLSGFGFGSQHLKNDGQLQSILTLPGILAPHTSMTLAFSLAMWDSIDFGGDLFQVTANGAFLINQTFGNYGGAADVRPTGPGTAITPDWTGSFSPDFGYGGHRDGGLAVSVTFAHSAPGATFTFQFPNTQTAPDEAFGIDNILVSTNAVAAIPEPSTYALMLAGLGFVGWAARRRKKPS